MSSTARVSCARCYPRGDSQVRIMDCNCAGILAARSSLTPVGRRSRTVEGVEGGCRRTRDVTTAIIPSGSVGGWDEIIAYIRTLSCQLAGRFTSMRSAGRPIYPGLREERFFSTKENTCSVREEAPNVWNQGVQCYDRGWCGVPMADWAAGQSLDRMKST